MLRFVVFWLLLTFTLRQELPQLRFVTGAAGKATGETNDGHVVGFPTLFLYLGHVGDYPVVFRCGVRSIVCKVVNPFQIDEKEKRVGLVA